MKHATLRSACWQTFRRDILLLLRKRMDFFQPLVFGFLVTLMFPLGLGPAPDLLATLAPGLVWIIALLSCLLATDGMFQQDYDDGSLTFLLLSPHPAYFLVMTRLWAQWLKSGLAVTLVAPVLGVMLQLPYQAIPAMVASLLAGTVSLVFIGAIGAALTVGLRNSGILLTLIILPLYVPVLIFGAAAVQASAEEMAVLPYLALLLSMMSLAITLAPLAVQAALRVNLDAA
jgi:heme exporter protein B